MSLSQLEVSPAQRSGELIVRLVVIRHSLFSEGPISRNEVPSELDGTIRDTEDEEILGWSLPDTGTTFRHSLCSAGPISRNDADGTTTRETKDVKILG